MKFLIKHVMLGDDVILMLDKNLKNKENVQTKGGKDTSHDEDLFKYDEYVEVKRPKITKKKNLIKRKQKMIKMIVSPMFQ